MRIQIDATSLLLRSAGVKNYVYYWTHALAREMRGHEITAFPLLGRVGPLDHERSVLGWTQTYARLGVLYFVNIRGNPAMNAIAAGSDVFHASNQVRNPPTNVLLTATIYDMTCLLMPEHHTAANVRAESNFASKVLRRAAGLIAISNHTKEDAVRVLGLDENRIRVIYPGVAERYFHVTAEEIGRVRGAYRLLKPYALFVGTIEPRKNIETLLDAWRQLPQDVSEQYDLIFAGPTGWAPGTAERLRAGEAGIRHLGYVPEHDLPAVTAGAALFVYPSLYEGFGFPPAQAMAAGVPVITSHVSSLPEVVGDAGLLIDPRSPSDLSRALSRALTSDSLRSRMAQAGAKRARLFTWERSARESADFFNRLAGPR